jgi:putative regulator of septum formation
MRSTPWLTGLLAVGLLTTLPVAQAAGRAHAAAKPVVGECRKLTAAEAAGSSDRSAPIPCSDSHNDRVIAVPHLPKGVSWSDLDTSHQVVKTGVRLCTSPYRSALGQTGRVRDRTAYSFVFFAPTPHQQSLGARWLRCDLVLVHGKKLAALPTDDEPALTDSTPPDAVARCLGGADLLTTPCAFAHAYRSTGTFVVAQQTYPGRAALLRLGRSRCPAVVSTDTNFRFTWSPKLVWNLVHDHVVVCYSHNKS